MIVGTVENWKSRDARLLIPIQRLCAYLVDETCVSSPFNIYSMFFICLM